MHLKLGEVAAILGASCATPETTVPGYSIDSRTISPGALFFAIRGPRFDGHDFAVQALERGAAGAVIESGFEERVPKELRAKLIPVDDTTEALQQLARATRRKWGRRVIAVTGSTGKTTTKELIAALLEPSLSVHKSEGNLNNRFGVPLAMLGLEPKHDVAVLELAMSAPGEIGSLARLAEPEVGVVTNIAPVHLEFFYSLDSIARAKHELIENLKPPAAAVLNYDDPRVRAFGEEFTGKVVTYGLEEGADFRALHVRQSLGRQLEILTHFIVTHQGFSGEFLLPLPGRHNVQNALAAISTARLFEVPMEEIRRALAAFETLRQRGEVLTLPSLVTIINDSYNSNPLAMTRMLETLATWPGVSRRIVVAGEMLELGPTSPDLHRQVGRKCVEARVDWLIAVQGDAGYFLEGAVRAGLPTQQARFFGDAESAGEFCRSLIKPLDVVLVKGSRGVHLEKVTELLQLSEKSETQSGVVIQGINQHFPKDAEPLIPNEARRRSNS